MIYLQIIGSYLLVWAILIGICYCVLRGSEEGEEKLLTVIVISFIAFLIAGAGTLFGVWFDRWVA